jgi:hypothetical protein
MKLDPCKVRAENERAQEKPVTDFASHCSMPALCFVKESK